MRRALEFVLPYRRRVLGISALALTVAVLGVAEPLVMKQIFDVLSRGGPTASIVHAVLLLLALLGTRTLVESWLAVATWTTRLDVDYAVRARLLGKLHTLPMAYHTAESVGGLVNRVNQAITGFVTAFAEVAFTVAPAVAYLVLSVIALARLDWRLMLVVLVFTPLPVLIGARAAREQTQRERTLMQRWAVLYSRLNEVLAGIRTVKAFSMEEVERRRFLSGQREGNAIVARGVRTDTTSGALRGLAVTVARLAAIAVGGWLLVRGEITVGTLVAVLGYLGGLFTPVQGLTNSYQTLRKGTVALEVIYEILDTPDPVADVAHPVELTDVRGDVRFEHVGFAYEDGTSVLADLDLDVRAGETIAIVGPSGSGKTTMVMLLQRLYPLTAGRITIDDVDIRELSHRSLHEHIGVVYQDVTLFNETVRDNIAYGRPTASDEEIEAVARAAHAHEFIMELPEGYDTVLGERGARLSGGQRQRLAIARALLRDAPILVLDEATSALDAAAESAVQAALAALTRGRTTFIIAHRLATVVRADRIVVLQHGHVVEVGSHVELMARGGAYAALVHRQADGLLLSPAA